MIRSIIVALLLTVGLQARAVDIAYAPPMGGMTIAVPAGQTRSVSLPLIHQSVAVGATLGRISAVGSNYIEDSAAGWVAGELSSATNPYYLRIRTGAAAGRIFMVTTTANTATRVNLTNDGTDLTTLGIEIGASGDIYELVMADTLGDLFGSVVQGGTDATTADNVLVWASTSWVSYYYNTAQGKWQRSTDVSSSPARDNLVLRPDRGIMITRRAATELKMHFTGRVPEVGLSMIHSRPGVSFLSLGLPRDISIGDLAFNTRVTSWKTGANASESVNADKIQVWSNTAWTIYYLNTSGNWQRSTDTEASPSRNAVAIPAGRPIMVSRVDPGAGATTLVSIPLNYTIAN